MRGLLLLIVSFIFIWLKPIQLKAQTFDLSAYLKDQNTKEVIPYANIVLRQKNIGQISNLDGYFKFTDLSSQDSIEVSFIGYESLRFAAYEALDDTIYMRPSTNLLEEAVIYADNIFLYELLSRAKETRTKVSRQAKTYYALDTWANDTKIESLESYYNGTFKSYDLAKLELKNGRLAIAPFDNRFFISSETSKALNLLMLFEDNTFFPKQPLQLSRKKIQKAYELRLKRKYTENKRTIFNIGFKPKEGIEDSFFEGELWIDSSSASVLKIRLIKEDSKVHPFLPVGNMKELLSVDLEINKSFEPIDGAYYMKSTDFIYHLEFLSLDNELGQVKSQAVLYAFDYSNIFELPYFDFYQGNYADYRHINASPYNEFFWSNISLFGMARSEKNESFFTNNKMSIHSQEVFLKNPYFKTGFLEHPYLFWSEKRLIFRDQATDYSKFSGVMPIHRYELKAQIYLDVNTDGDSINFLTSSVFDPFQSYYHFSIDPTALAFINIYFDLIELERQKLDQDLRKAKSTKEIKVIYEANRLQLETVSELYFKSVDRGSNQREFEKYNLLIDEKLGINNLELFNQLTENQEEEEEEEEEGSESEN